MVLTSILLLSSGFSFHESPHSFKTMLQSIANAVLSCQNKICVVFKHARYYITFCFASRVSVSSISPVFSKLQIIFQSAVTH